MTDEATDTDTAEAVVVVALIASLIVDLLVYAGLSALALYAAGLILSIPLLDAPAVTGGVLLIIATEILRGYSSGQ